MPAADQPSSKIALILTLAGAIPFFAGALLLWIDSPIRPTLLTQALTAYAVVILSFLGGIQWGTALSINESAPRSAKTLFMFSVIAPMLGWGLIFIDADRLKLIVAIMLFALVWAIDALLRLQQLIPAWFFRLRCIVTAIVAIALLISAVRI